MIRDCTIPELRYIDLDSEYGTFSKFSKEDLQKIKIGLEKVLTQVKEELNGDSN